MSAMKYGFIGIGNIGMPMARSIAKNGLPITVYDLNKDAVEEMKSLGAAAAGSCREVAEASDAVFSMVRDISQNDEVIFGKDGLWDGLREGSIIIITSTVGPTYCQEVYAKVKEKGVQVIDAGVSKSIPTNEEGQLTLMIGGDDDAVKKCWPAFESMAKYIFHVGGIGMGQAYKLVNNMAAFNLITVTRECLNLGLKAGLDLQTMIDVMIVSTGGCWGLTNMAHTLKSGRQTPRPPTPPPDQTSAPLGNKDMDLAIEMAERVGANIPVAKFMEKLDTASEYEAISAAMRR